jgi:hypothetical protein
MTSADILKIFPEARCADATYNPPSIEWVESVFKSYKTLATMAKVWRWREHHDCDDKATMFRCVACAKWAQRKARASQGVAVGEVWYMPDAGGAHAINVVVATNGSLKYVEPQGPKWVELSKKEIGSIFFVRF